jgi:membrane-bound lytic murein transglycosylase MltF
MIKILLILTCLFSQVAVALESIPRDAFKFKRELIRTARFYHGMDAPIALYAAQIDAESTWRYYASSAYADGLTQFTPDSGEWVGDKLDNISYVNPLSPSWAMRAMIGYSLYLRTKFDSADLCNEVAFSLSAYNGGSKWVYTDKKIATSLGLDHTKWFGNVELNTSPKRRRSAFKENREYPRKILGRLQAKYAHWGGVLIPCEIPND